MLHIDGAILAAQAVTFALAAWVAWRVGWGPLLRLLDERRQRIQAALERAEAARADVARLEEEYRRRARQMDELAAGAREEARREAVGLREEILAEAQREILQMRRAAEEHARHEGELLRRELRVETARLAVEMAEKVLRASADPQVQARRLEEVLAQLESGASRTPGEGT